AALGRGAGAPSARPGAGGGRGGAAGLLARRLAAPLPDPAAIARRHDAVEFFVTDAAARADMRERLAAAPDLARALARLVVARGGPRDLAAIRDGIVAAGGLADE